MAEVNGHDGMDLTLHLAAERRYGGRTSRDWWRFYGLVAVLWFLLVLTYTRYLELFDNLESKSAGFQAFVMFFSGSALLMLLPAACAFIWWAAGALVNYSLWQKRQFAAWRWFWVVVLAFYAWVEFDPLDAIHPVMSHKGLGNAPHLVAMFEAGYKLSDGIPLTKFQWGYFLLWVLFWFLVVALHWQYLLNGLREVWFYVKRFHRYGASVLTGFRETAQAARQLPVTSAYPQSEIVLSQAYRGVPRLNVDSLSPEQAEAVIAADASGAITAAPDQSTILFVDLGRYVYSPALAELMDEQGSPLLSFSDSWAEPGLSRAELVIPLGSAQRIARESAAGPDEEVKDSPAEPVAADSEPQADAEPMEDEAVSGDAGGDE